MHKDDGGGGSQRGTNRGHKAMTLITYLWLGALLLAVILQQAAGYIA
jgi:hypothetical protein